LANDLKNEKTFGEEIVEGFNWVGKEIKEFFVGNEKPEPKGVHQIIYKGKKVDLIEKALVTNKVKTKSGQIKNVTKVVKDLLVVPTTKKADAVVIVKNNKITKPDEVAIPAAKVPK